VGMARLGRALHFYIRALTTLNRFWAENSANGETFEDWTFHDYFDLRIGLRRHLAQIDRMSATMSGIPPFLEGHSDEE